MIKSMRFKSNIGQSSFTLVELLIVMGIVSVLAAVVVIVINPIQIMAESRDSQRLAELNTINSALIYYQSVNGTGYGTATNVYISLPDLDGDTQCIDDYPTLPDLAAGYSYFCNSSLANLRNLNGTGWIPVNFSSKMSNIGSFFSSLPVDPKNTAAGSFFYSYIPGGSWALSAEIESTKYLSDASGDNGQDATRFEIGSDINLNLALVEAAESCSDSIKNQDETDVDCGGDICDTCANGLTCSDNNDCTSGNCSAGVCAAAWSYPTEGLVAHWNFDENTGTTAADSSGNERTLTMWQTLTWVSGISGSALHNAGGFFNHNNAAMKYAGSFGATTEMTMNWWIKPDNIRGGEQQGWSINSEMGYSNYYYPYDGFSLISGGVDVSKQDLSITADTWYMLTLTYKRNGKARFYFNGSLVAGREETAPDTDVPAQSGFNACGYGSGGWNADFEGSCDEYGVWTRQLSDAEILDIYNNQRP
ncbi:MAG: prepilin-type N-terminal cleavage/methylation domain-containing protein [Candidatus Pacebacteria bacterium]|nr:prepilin-type N-terminal cleavage/methylation domain-containing protein [Candidatus Paceibacterota bacterium]